VTPKSLDQRLARFLRLKRGDHTYTQFARKVGLRESTLFRIENGQQSTTLRAVQQILKGLRCSYDDVFGTPTPSSRVAESRKPLPPSPKKALSKVSYKKASRKKKEVLP
jgi:transcriptional regulator with XRE-family HTH domain